jgi:hypothetical protein
MIIDMDNAIEWDFRFGPMLGCFTIFPYQLSLGISVRWFESRPALRLYGGPLKLALDWHVTERNQHEEQQTKSIRR